MYAMTINRETETSTYTTVRRTTLTGIGRMATKDWIFFSLAVIGIITIMVLLCTIRVIKKRQDHRYQRERKEEGEA